MNFKSPALRAMTLFLALAIFFCSCSSTTIIQSTPSEAKVYLNGEYVGTTPHRHSDTKIVGSSTQVTLEKEGYEDFNTVFARDEKLDVGALIGGLFVLVPFLWVMKYKPNRTFEMKPETGASLYGISPTALEAQEK